MVTKKRRQGPLALRGSVWITAGDESLGGRGRVALLRAVAEQGTLTHAAKACGISYKAAWDAIDTMNQRAGAPLVQRMTGGRGGGFTQLTEHGQALVERFEQIEAAHQRYVALLDRQAFDLAVPFSPLQALNLRTSARNQWVGSVVAVRAGAVNDEVELELPGGTRLVAIVTRASSDALALRPRQTAFALAKATAVLLAVEEGGARLSARNRLPGQVLAVEAGAASAEVTLEAEGGVRVTAVVPLSAVADLALAPGRAAVAYLKASDLLLAVAG